MIVLVDFVDLKDNNYRYRAGDPFPRVGAVVSPARMAELSGDGNALGHPVIGEKVASQATAKEATTREVPVAETHDVPVSEPVEAPVEKAPRKRRRKNAD